MGVGNLNKADELGFKLHPVEKPKNASLFSICVSMISLPWETRWQYKT